MRAPEGRWPRALESSQPPIPWPQEAAPVLQSWAGGQGEQLQGSGGEGMARATCPARRVLCSGPRARPCVAGPCRGAGGAPQQPRAGLLPSPSSGCPAPPPLPGTGGSRRAAVTRGPAAGLGFGTCHVAWGRSPGPSRYLSRRRPCPRPLCPGGLWPRPARRPSKDPRPVASCGTGPGRLAFKAQPRHARSEQGQSPPTPRAVPGAGRGEAAGAALTREGPGELDEGLRLLPALLFRRLTPGDRAAGAGRWSEPQVGPGGRDTCSGTTGVASCPTLWAASVPRGARRGGRLTCQDFGP